MPFSINILLAFLSPVLFVVLLHTLARKWKRATVSWGHCISLLGIVLLVAIIASRLPLRALLNLPPPMSVLVLSLMIALVGGWFLKGRGQRADGAAFTFADGAILAGLAALGVALLGLLIVSLWTNLGPLRMLR